MVAGTLIDPPTTATLTPIFRLNVTQINNGQKNFNVNGLLLAHVPINQIYEYGDEVSLARSIANAASRRGFFLSDYLARQGHSQLHAGQRSDSLAGQ